MAWCRIGDKPLSKPMLTWFTDAYICGARERRVNIWLYEIFTLLPSRINGALDPSLFYLSLINTTSKWLPSTAKAYLLSTLTQTITDKDCIVNSSGTETGNKCCCCCCCYVITSQDIDCVGYIRGLMQERLTPVLMHRSCIFLALTHQNVSFMRDDFNYFSHFSFDKLLKKCKYIFINHK